MLDNNLTSEGAVVKTETGGRKGQERRWASDRPAAEETFKKLDQVMQERHSWRVEEAKLEDQPVTTWTSRFAGLTVTRGWLNGDVVFLAIGPGTANALIPAPDKALASTDLFRTATQTNLEAPQGNFFMAVDRLANPNVSLPVPALPDANRAVLNAIRAIGLTTTVQDSRTLRFEGRTVLQRSENAPAALPAPGETAPAASPADSSEPNPEAEPSE